jgi:hypothetical protein
MTNQMPFDHQPDPELGTWLRQTLDGPAPEAFVARLGAVARAAASESTWDVLARWAPAGLVAAGLAAAMVALLLGRLAEPAPAEMMAGVAVPAQFDMAPLQPEADLVAVNVLEGR